jgi:hypothetical protein
MERAARTHWRAAAWLLERTDPDHYAKRPPNVCSPATLQDVCDWLIETALEATPPEHREAVYRRMRGVADKAFNVLMPDQTGSRRALIGTLPRRPMPLLQNEWSKVCMRSSPPHLPAVGVSSAPAGSLPSPQAVGPPAVPPANELATATPDADPAGSHPNSNNRDATHRRGATVTVANPITRLSATDYDATAIADPVTFYCRHPWKPSLPYEPPSKYIDGLRRQDVEGRKGPLDEDDEEDDDATPVVGGVDSAAACASAAASPERDPPPEQRACEPAPQATGGSPSAHPPNGGIMSPKMSAATEPDATNREPTDGPDLRAPRTSPAPLGGHGVPTKNGDPTRLESESGRRELSL